MTGDAQTSAGWIQRTTWWNGTVPVGSCTPWCAVLHLFQIALGYFCIFIDLGSLYIPICTRRSRSNFCSFCNWICSLGSVTNLVGNWRKAFWEVQSPWIWSQVLLQAAWRVPGRGEIPALSWFGFWPDIAPHKMFKEVLEYLSKWRIRIVFVRFQQLHPVCAAQPRVSAEVRGFCHLISPEEGQDPNPSVYCSFSMF